MFDHEAGKSHLTQTIVLVGMMGAGKSAIGRCLSERLDVLFEDSDDAIELAANRTISDIFARDGEAFFRRREREVIERLLTGAPMILAVGGGAYLQERTREVIEAHSVSMWLNPELDVLWERVRHKDTRPLLRTEDPYQTLKDIWAQRVLFYQQAKMRLDIGSGDSIDQTTQAVLDVLREHSCVASAQCSTSTGRLDDKTGENE